MARRDQVRYQLFLPKDVARRFEALAAAPGTSKSSILAAALTAFLNLRGASEIEERLALRLDRISKQLGRIERDGHIGLESQGLFIRYMLTVNAPLAEEGDGNWQDFLADTRPTPEEVVTGLRDAETRSRWLNEALTELSAREQTIIRQRRLQEEGATLEELGRSLGVSKERVRQLEQRALEKLRSHIERRIEHRPEEPGDLMVEMVDA